MTDLLSNLALGLLAASTPENLFYCFVGTLVGTLVGVLPGIGPVGAVAMLLPLTLSLPTLPAIIMMAGIYYGTQYGGSTTAILTRLPGEMSSVVTCLDGHEMAKAGRAGSALAISAIASFVAGCIATLLIAVLAMPLAEVALQFRSVEYFSLMVLGLVAAVTLSPGSFGKTFAMACLGLGLGLVGLDVNSGESRMTFGVAGLRDGIEFITIAMGLFGLPEIIEGIRAHILRPSFSAMSSLWPSRREFAASWAPILRGTAIGSSLGVLPGAGPTIASFAAYAAEVRLAKDPSRFGRGAIEGVAAPEAANNAASQTAFIPMLTLGIPGSATTALVLGALMIHGIAPGPKVMTEHPELVWGFIASMWIGNLMLVILNLPLVGLWVRLLSVPYRYLYPALLVFIGVGTYSANNSILDVVLTAAFGVLGYIFLKLDCQPTALLLGFILGPMMEENFRRSMVLSGGDGTVFFTHPISLTLLLVSAGLVVAATLPAIRKKKVEMQGAE